MKTETCLRGSEPLCAAENAILCNILSALFSFMREVSICDLKCAINVSVIIICTECTNSKSCMYFFTVCQTFPFKIYNVYGLYILKGIHFHSSIHQLMKYYSQYTSPKDQAYY